MNDKQAENRLDLIEAAINDYKAGSLSPLATLVAVGTIVCPGEVGEKEKRWAIDAILKQRQNDPTL